MDKGAQSLARTRAWSGRQELLGSLEPEVKKAGWWCALVGLASLFPPWSGSTVTPPPARTLRLVGLTASYNGSFQSFGLRSQLCRSQVHLIFPFYKMGCTGWRESE